MSKTKIEWADYTLNPITGCTPISDGCQHCYAKKMAKRLAGRCGYDKDEPFGVTFHPDKLNLKGIKPGSIVFLNSMGDMFHDDVRVEWIDEILEKVIYPAYRMEPMIHFVVLTKRPENIMWKMYGQNNEITVKVFGDEYVPRSLGGGDYYPNLHIGITCENQQEFDKRIYTYFDVAAQNPMCDGVISFEPLLDSVYILPYASGISWALVGGETGNQARYCDYMWIVGLHDQCSSMNIPFLFKQWGRNSDFYEDYYKQPISRLLEAVESTRQYPVWRY